MRVELREKVIERLEEVSKWAGAPDFDAGMQQATKFFTLMQDATARMQTKDALRKLLDELPDPTPAEEALLSATANFMPQIISVVLKQLARVIQNAAPVPPGRPSVDFLQKGQVVAYVGKLHTQGCSLELSKARAAQKFGLSESTVQRTWDDRGSLGDADFRSALRWLLDGEP